MSDVEVRFPLYAASSESAFVPKPTAGLDIVLAQNRFTTSAAKSSCSSELRVSCLSSQQSRFGRETRTSHVLLQSIPGIIPREDRVCLIGYPIHIG